VIDQQDIEPEERENDQGCGEGQRSETEAEVSSDHRTPASSLIAINGLFEKMMSLFRCSEC
jgi:hypothetical protein